MYCNFGKAGSAGRIVGIMDDNPALKNLNVYGFKVHGGIEELGKIHERLNFDKVVITCEEMAADNQEKLKKFCAEKNIELKKFICTENEM